MTDQADVTPVEREILALVVDDDATPLAEILGTIAIVLDIRERDRARHVVRDAIAGLMTKGLISLVYYDPPFRYEDRRPISQSLGQQLLDQEESWLSPVERPKSRHVRATATRRGQELFF